MFADKVIRVKKVRKVKKIIRRRKKKASSSVKSISVYDLMTSDVITIDAQNSLESLIHILAERNISGMPVIENDKLVGVVGKGSVLKMTGVDDLNKITDDMLDSLRKVRVRDVMENPATIFYKDNIKRAAGLMAKFNTDRLIAVDADKKMVGIITKTDLVKGVSQIVVRKRLETTIDEVLDTIKKKGSITIDEIAERFKVDKAVVEEWARILEEHKLIVVNYPVIGKPYLSSAKE